MYSFSKRFFDILISLICILLLLPIFTLIIIILRFSAEGEIFYLQERLGYRNKSFKIIKFATMLKNSENIGTGTITLRNDFRVTKPGKFLRITKINELPQIINILKGDISFVGPRPLMKKTFDDYPLDVKRMIYDSKPGLTGIGSIFFRDEESVLSSVDKEKVQNYYKNIVAPYKGQLEKWYYHNRSVLTDLKLLFITAWVVLFPKSKIVRFFFKNLPDTPAELDKLLSN